MMRWQDRVVGLIYELRLRVKGNTFYYSKGKWTKYNIPWTHSWTEYCWLLKLEQNLNNMAWTWSSSYKGNIVCLILQMTLYVVVSSLSFPFILEPALSSHAQTPNAGYKLQRTGYHCQFAKCLSSNTVQKNSQRKVKIHLLVRRQMWMPWEAVGARSSGVWFIIAQLLKHSPQMQVDSTFVTMKDFDTYWSQGRDMERCCCLEWLTEALSPQNMAIIPLSPEH